MPIQKITGNKQQVNKILAKYRTKYDKQDRLMTTGILIKDLEIILSKNRKKYVTGARNFFEYKKIKEKYRKDLDILKQNTIFEY